MLSIETLAVHAGKADLIKKQLHVPPIDLSTTYPFTDLNEATESLDELVAGAESAKNPVYARLHNPTVAGFERALAELEGAEEAVAFGSGMAAITACLMVAKEDGGHVVALRPMYGTADHLLTSGLLDLKVTWAEPDTIADVVTNKTALVYLETPANPLMNLFDISDIVRQAHGVPVLVDSTFATPVLQRPIELGAAYALHSGTKFLGGHGDVIAGVVACASERAAKLRRIRLMTGALLHPLGGYLLHRGLATLPVRIYKAQETAQSLAGRLAEHSAVTKVFYPGLSGSDPRGLIGTQMAGPGTMVSFEIQGRREDAARFVTHLKVMTNAVSLGSVDTLIQNPASLTHRVLDEETREAIGISECLFRISVGLEHPEDLWNDLDMALKETVRVLGRSSPSVQGA